MASILLVEDDHIMLTAIQNYLRKDGFQIVAAKDGKEALEKLHEANYDIVISDLMMPYTNGLEIISRIRNDETKNRTGIIIVSSVGNEESILEAFKLGADDYLKKPIMLSELVIRVKKLLQDKQRKYQ